jgi:hypothetical protein
MPEADPDPVYAAQRAVKRAAADNLLILAFNPLQRRFSALQAEQVYVTWVRRAVQFEEQSMRLEYAACHEDFLGQVYDQLKLEELHPPSASLSAVAKAEVIRVMFAELDSCQEVEVMGKAQKVLLRLVDAIVALLDVLLLPTPPDLPAPARPNFFRQFHEADIDLFKRIKGCGCDVKDPEWTHSSLMGRRDWFTFSGKLKVPSAMASQVAQAVALCYSAGRPMTLVERQTPNYPYTEDVDVLAPALQYPPDKLLFNPDDCHRFWAIRAAILHEVFPAMNPLRLVLFSASGRSREKKCPKTSFHCVWPQIIVDTERAHVVRLQTVDRLTALSQPEYPLCQLAQQLQEAMTDPTGATEPPTDIWNTIFDITAVRAGTFRMPLNDKWYKAEETLEGRPVRPLNVIDFRFNPETPGALPQVFVADNKMITHAQWVQLGSVRRPAGTALTVWCSPIPRPTWTARRQPTASSSYKPKGPGRAATPEAAEPAAMFKYSGTVADFKRQLDYQMSDPEGNQSTLSDLPGGHVTWKQLRVKGCIRFTPEAGLLFVQGNEEQKTFLVDLLKGWTEPWVGFGALGDLFVAQRPRYQGPPDQY